MLDQITGLRVFVRVAALGNLSAAGRALGLSQTMVTRHIGAIEERLGAELLHRTTRRVTLTEAGQRYLDAAERILSEWTEAEAAATAGREPSGLLRLNVPLAFGLRQIAPLIPAFRRLHPKVTVELGMTDRVVDIVDEGWDIAIRIGRLRDSSLTARRLASVRSVVVAAPDYLAARGTPIRIAELAQHDCLGYTLPTAASAGRWLFGRDGERVVAVNPVFRANNGDALRIAALAGQGLAYQPSFIVADDLAAGRLVALTFEVPTPEPLGVHAVYPPGRHPPAKVRAIIDFLAERWGDPSPWDRVGAASAGG